MTFAEELVAAAVGPVADRAFGDPEALRDPLSALREDFGDEPGTPGDHASLAEIVGLFRDGKPLRSRDLARCCSGAALPLDGRRILESVEDSRRLVSAVGELAPAEQPPPTSQRRCFRALARSYFVWAPEDRSGTTSPWAEARSWLHDFTYRDSLPSAAPWPTIRERRSVFSESPCLEFSHLELASPQVEDLRTAFGIPQDSWFFEELLRARIDRACESNDAQFRDRIDLLLLELEPYNSLVNWALARLLERYEKTSFKSVAHERLADLAVEVWKTPRDSANYPNWNRVSKATREMVAQWLALKIIDQVFAVFGETTGENEANERASFWRQWAPAMSELHLFVDSRYIGAFEPITALVGDSHWSRITEGDSAGADHAFLMEIGQYSFVEFSRKGNAMYPYETADLPFTLSKRTYSIRGLKNRERTVKVPGSNASGDVIDAWTHQGRWQQNYAKRMQQYLGLRR